MYREMYLDIGHEIVDSLYADALYSYVQVVH